MPTLFSRKYMGGKPKRTERLVGAFVLVLLAFIIGAFLLTGGLFAGLVDGSSALRAAKGVFGISERPLFVPAPENLKPPPPPHELRVAQMMLPVLPEPWTRSEVSAAGNTMAGLPVGFEAVQVYSAGYAGGAGEYAAQIADMVLPETAAGAWQAMTPVGARPLAIGRGGWIDADGRRAVFWAGRYLTQLSGQGSGDADQLEALARSLAAVQLNYGGPFVAESAPADTPAAPAPKAAGGAARFAEVKGGDVQPPVKIERFTDNLYEKIDGREGQFRAFGFVELRFGQYQDVRRRTSYDVYIYDMGQANNALGIFTAERSEGAEPLAVGQGAYLSGTSAYFHKDKYYVNVLGPADGDKPEAQVAERIATAIAETIAGGGGKLWADALLPAEGRAGPLRYQTTSALSQDFLERFFFCKYTIGGASLEMFIHKAPGAAEAKALFAKYAEEAPKFDHLVSRKPSDGGETVVTEMGGVYTVAFHKGPYFAGVTECKDREVAVKQAAGLCAKLNANDPGEPFEPKAATKGESSEGGGGHGY